MRETICTLSEGDSAIIATAIHDGHDVRDDIADLYALTEEERLREEDPHTGDWTDISPNRIICHRSRFEFDINRRRDKSIYIEPEDSWGLKVWIKEPTPSLIQHSLKEYDSFYSDVFRVLKKLEMRYTQFVVLDLHTYNHRREGPNAAPADPDKNPEVNIGTGTMNRDKWAHIVDPFIDNLRSFDFMGRNLDVRENIKFKGGFFPQWIHQNFPESGCTISIEFKKFFMDEWTGQAYPEQVQAIRTMLESTMLGLESALNQ